MSDPGTRVEFRRLDDRFPPLRELLFVEPDGSFRMWRSNDEAVGRFAGTLPDPAGFATLAAAAAATAPPDGGGTSSPDATDDELRVGEAVLTTRPSDRGSGAWGAVLEACRSLLDALLDQPSAAIALELPSPGIARLVHAGSSTLPIELGAMRIAAEVYRDTSRIGAASPDSPGVHHVDAGPGWSLEIPIPQLDVPADAMLLVRIGFVADDEGVMVPVEASRSWEPASG